MAHHDVKLAKAGPTHLEIRNFSPPRRQERQGIFNNPIQQEVERPARIVIG
jgi:hypothetical protein